MLTAHSLVKTYGDFKALNEVSFLIRPGEIFGYLGPNGAGKTTTINILTLMSRADSGTVTWNGKNLSSIPDYKNRIGIVPAEPFLYDMMTGREFLHYIADIRKIPRKQRTCIAEYLQMFEIAQDADKLTGSYSTGMKKKISVIAAFIHAPEILFLDEPTMSLDALSVFTFKKLLEKYRQKGTAVFLTTHILEIAEKLCNHVGIIHKGTLIHTGTVDEILARHNHKSLEEFFVDIA